MAMITYPIDEFLISLGLVNELKEYAEKTLPIESCALLLGPVPPSTSRQVETSELIFTSNVSSNPTVRFEIPPEELLKVYNHADATNQAIVGVFHSHPAPPYPSSTDINNMKINPCVWVICGGPENEIKAYQFRDQHIYSVVLRIT